MRAIAADAGADPALVIRYFGSKQGLYEAATTQIELNLPDFLAVPRTRLGVAVISAFLDRWEGTRGEPLRVLLASAATDPAAAAQMREVFTDQVHPAVVVAAHDEQEARVALVVSTVVGLAMSRYVLRLPRVVGLGRGELVRIYGPVVQQHLTRPLGPHDAQPTRAR